MNGQAGACPQCGAPIRFGGAHSLASVCSYCRTAVVRRGADIASIGKVPDLVSTSTQLDLGDSGKLDGAGFRIAGRLQLDQGAAKWDEWYAQFDDGSDGWVAEAQGALYVTRRLEGHIPPALNLLVPGGRLDLPKLGKMAVQEVGTAQFVSAVGELPFEPRVGATYRFADLSGHGGKFATIDYGEDDRDPPELFAGRRISYGDAQLQDDVAARKKSAQAAPVAGPEGTGLTCPSCGAPISLQRKQSESAECPSCRTLLDVNAGALSVVGKLRKRTQPLIPLGAKGTLQGEQVEVLGYLRRYAQVDGSQYEWSEWQLAGPKGYAWLSEYQGQFHWSVPINAGEVGGAHHHAQVMCRGMMYRHFADSTSKIRDIQGELSWHARLEDEVQGTDFIAPPFLLSCEREKGEINWSQGEWISGAEVWKGLALPGEPPRAVGVGMAQPNPHDRARKTATRSSVIGFFALVALAVVIGRSMPRQQVAQLVVPLQGGERIALSEPFDLPSSMQSVAIIGTAPLQNAWAGLDLALIKEDTGEARTLGMELSHFEGIDDGERWSEGNRVVRATLGRVPRGRYLLRAEVTLDPASAARVPPLAHLQVVRGVFVFAPLFIAMLLLVPYPLITRMRWSAFERERWRESDHGDDE